jgi:hypothetical protein
LVTVCKEQGPPDYLLNGKGMYTREVNISLHALLTLGLWWGRALYMDSNIGVAT